MTIRIVCPFCKTANALSDEKRGKKAACRGCKKALSVPMEDGEEDAIQDKRPGKVKAVAASRRRDEDDDDDDDERRDDRVRKSSAKLKGKNAKKGVPVGLIIGGVAGLFLLLLLGGAGVVAALILRAAPVKTNQVAQAPEPNNQAPVDVPVAFIKPAEKPPQTKPEPGLGAPKTTPASIGTLPDRMAPDTVRRVKDSTVQLNVSMPNGQQASGSGFFCMEPGIIITNAHVLGMLRKNGQMPARVEVVVHSGEPNVTRLQGSVLGVDRASDLAVVRVDGANLPPPLPIEATNVPFETQKVYVAGFPFGRRLGPDITISESSITSLRKDVATGMIRQIQVNGGMQPGNSGGPVVNANGNVVGVAVSIIAGTQINFAIPTDFVKLVMSGRHSDALVGEAFLQNEQTLLPVKFTCLDPLNRVKQMYVEVWTGMPGPSRPYSLQQPQPAPGDAPRQKVDLVYVSGAAKADIVLPTAPPGQVQWLQPVLVTADGSSNWGRAFATPVDLAPVERKPANLMTDLTKVTERTVKLKANDSATIADGKQRSVFADNVEVDFLETLKPDPDGASIRIAFGPTVSLASDINGKTVNASKQAMDMLRALPPMFVMDGTGHMKRRVSRKLNPKLSQKLVEEFQGNFGQMCNAIEAVMVPSPNRVVQPLENFNVKVPLILATAAPGRPTKVADLELLCTYEGTRMRNQRAEALVTIAGRVKGRGLDAKRIGGDVSGKIGIDTDGGYISSAKLKIISEFDTGNSDVQISIARETDLERQAGNPLNIQPPPDKTPAPGPKNVPPADPGKGKSIVNQKGFLTIADPFDPVQYKLRKVKLHMKIVPVALQAGKTYVISLSSSTFDAFLRVGAPPTGGIVAFDDNSGGGTNARVTFTARVTGNHNIIVSSTNGKTGTFQLSVVQNP